MAAKLLDEFSITPEIAGGERGVFDVFVDGALVFSKHKEGRFPSESEVIDLVRAL